VFGKRIEPIVYENDSFFHHGDLLDNNTRTRNDINFELVSAFKFSERMFTNIVISIYDLYIHSLYHFTNLCIQNCYKCLNFSLFVLLDSKENTGS
jgi:hypothetical protein